MTKFLYVNPHFKELFFEIVKFFKKRLDFFA